MANRRPVSFIQYLPTLMSAQAPYVFSAGGTHLRQVRKGSPSEPGTYTPTPSMILTCRLLAFNKYAEPIMYEYLSHFLPPIK